MRKVLGIVTCLICLAACGGGSSSTLRSGPSEVKVRALVRKETPLTDVTCVKARSGDDRDFICNGENGPDVTVDVVVGEDGKSVVFENCEAGKSAFGDPCEGMGG